MKLYECHIGMLVKLNDINNIIGYIYGITTNDKDEIMLTVKWAHNDTYVSNVYSKNISKLTKDDDDI